MQTYTQQVAFLGGIFIGAVVLVAALAPVLGPIVRFAMP
jgi:hypothetical protein